MTTKKAMLADHDKMISKLSMRLFVSFDVDDETRRMIACMAKAHGRKANRWEVAAFIQRGVKQGLSGIGRGFDTVGKWINYERCELCHAPDRIEP